MKKEYVAWVSDPSSLPPGEEVQLTIRDLTPGKRKYEARNVKAIVSSSPEELPDGDILWLRSAIGVMLPHPRGIKITQDLGECLPGTPYQ
jgi:hypothetical protein